MCIVDISSVIISESEYLSIHEIKKQTKYLFNLSNKEINFKERNELVNMGKDENLSETEIDLNDEIIEEDKEQVREKPKCALIGEDGNIFNLMGIASRTLKNNGLREEAKEMCDRITSSGSYHEALGIIGEYVDICSKDELDEEYDEEMDMGMEGGMC